MKENAPTEAVGRTIKAAMKPTAACPLGSASLDSPKGRLGFSGGALALIPLHSKLHMPRTGTRAGWSRGMRLPRSTGPLRSIAPWSEFPPTRSPGGAVKARVCIVRLGSADTVRVGRNYPRTMQEPVSGGQPVIQGVGGAIEGADHVDTATGRLPISPDIAPRQRSRSQNQPLPSGQPLLPQHVFLALPPD